jgi:hypothetical protein
MDNSHNEINLNIESAQESMAMLGYAPNPYCEHCKGFGKVYPMRYDGKPDYSQSVMCQAKGCLAESYRNRTLK